jgi:hypothetical protein
MCWPCAMSPCPSTRLHLETDQPFPQMQADRHVPCTGLPSHGWWNSLMSREYPEPMGEEPDLSREDWTPAMLGLITTYSKHTSFPRNILETYTLPFSRTLSYYIFRRKTFEPIT